MNQKKQILSEALQQAGTASSYSPELAELLKNRITEDTKLPKMEYLYEIFSTPCFARGELTVGAGKAKSGKTLFLSLLMAKAVWEADAGGDDFMPAIQRRREKPLRVLWYDTEQSRQSTQDILVNRILALTTAPTPDGQEEHASAFADRLDDCLYAFNVRTYSWEERLKMFQEAIPYVKPDLVILDGVRDLISDINDGMEAQRITEQLMMLAQTYNCCIVCVLHLNKGDSDHNLRGWLGTELTNKVYEVFLCEKLKGSSTFKVKQDLSRKYEIEREIYYRVNHETGLPEPTEKTASQPRDSNGRWTSAKAQAGKTADGKWEAFNQQYIISHPENPEKPYEWDLRRLFNDALEGRPYRPYGEVMGVVLKLTNIQDKNVYYAVFDEAVAQRIIRKVVTPDRGQQLVLPYENRLEFEDLPF